MVYAEGVVTIRIIYRRRYALHVDLEEPLKEGLIIGQKPKNIKIVTIKSTIPTTKR